MLHVSFVAAAHRGSVRNGHRQAASPWPGPASPPGATTLAPSSHLSPELFRAQSSRYLLWMRLLSVFTLKTPNRAVRCVKGDSDEGGRDLASTELVKSSSVGQKADGRRVPTACRQDTWRLRPGPLDPAVPGECWPGPRHHGLTRHTVASTLPDASRRAAGGCMARPLGE